MTAASACFRKGKACTERARFSVMITALDHSTHKPSTLASLTLVHLIRPAGAGVNVDIRVADDNCLEFAFWTAHDSTPPVLWPAAQSDADIDRP